MNVIDNEKLQATFDEAITKMRDEIVGPLLVELAKWRELISRLNLSEVK